MTRTTMLALLVGCAAYATAAPVPTGPAMPGGATTAAPSNPQPSAKPGALTPEQYKVLDSALTQAETVVLDLESIANGGVDGTGCPPSFSVREYMADLKNKRATKETGDDLIDNDATHKENGGPKIEWQFYYLCQAIATKNPVACAEASSVSPKTLNKDTDYRSGLSDANSMSVDQALAMQSAQSYEGKCSKAYYQERAKAAFIAKAPNFMELCRQAVPHMAELKSPAAGEAMCAAWRDYNGNAEPFIAAIQAGVAHPLKREYALDVVREMTVEPGSCGKASREVARRYCKEQEDYRQALATKNISACRGGLCRVYMGEGLAACESYAKKFKANACTQRYANDFLASGERKFKGLSDQVETALTASDGGIGDPKALKEFNVRLDKLLELRGRFDKASEKIFPKAAKKGAAPAPAAGKKGT